MARPVCLNDYLENAVQMRADETALVEPRGGGPPLTLSYRELADLSGRLRDRLAAMGIGIGDRVGILLHKSIDSVATIHGILRSGAAYVPVDPTAPAARDGFIFHDCGVRAVVVEAKLADALAAEMAKLGSVPPFLVLEGVGGGAPLSALLDRFEREAPAPPVATLRPGPDELAYVLYTSGSTGKPKGVMLTHLNATSFVEWCKEAFEPRPEDRFSSHAPFHFDLSILDLYLPVTVGAALVIVNEDIGKDGQRLAALIEETGITCWYSAPSILSLLAQFGQLETRDYRALRIVHFAGEVFPIKHLKLLKQLVPHPRYFNLYGPTETNVCTYCEIPAVIPEERTEPYPIGKACSHYRIRVVDEQGKDVARGAEGELIAAGPGVMRGYWNLPELSSKAFLVDERGGRWYRTGDVVAEEPGGDYRFLGRRDRMVKKRGYRVELGEIEAALYRHPEVKEAAVVAIPDEAQGLLVKAFLSTRSGEKISVIALKRFCAEKLPLYMVPDSFTFLETLPKTSTDKVDYQRLKETR